MGWVYSFELRVPVAQMKVPGYVWRAKMRLINALLAASYKSVCQMHKGDVNHWITVKQRTHFALEMIWEKSHSSNKVLHK